MKITPARFITVDMLVSTETLQFEEFSELWGGRGYNNRPLEGDVVSWVSRTYLTRV